MPSLETLMLISGILHLGTLLGSAQVPKELRFKEDLPKLNPVSYTHLTLPTKA